LFRNAEYIINGKCNESINYVDMKTTVKILLEFCNDYSWIAATNMFWYEDKNILVDSFKVVNEFESTFAPVAAGRGTITTKRIKRF
jgi:hypothetical protein